MRLRLVLATILFCLTCPLAFAENTNSIWFAGQYIKIGTPKARIFDKLVSDYKLRKVGDTDQWAVQDSAPPHRHVGIIAFKNGKVDFVNKSWGGGEETYGKSMEPFEIIYRALSSISEEGKPRPIVLELHESKDPEGSIKTIRLNFGKKTFEIGIPNMRDSKNAVSLSEILWP